MNAVETVHAGKAEPLQPAKGRGRGPVANSCWLAAAIVVVALSCFHFPQSLMNKMLDPSWSGVLVYAHEKGMQFGRDIIFTYGPLGFLSVASFLPEVAGLRIVFEIVVGIWIATGICLLAWRMPVPWRVAMLGYFLFVSMPLHWGGDALLIDVGIFAWGLLCLLESGARLPIFALALIILVAAGALVKFTFFVSGLFTIGVLACDLAIRGKRLLAGSIIVGTLVAIAFGWLLLGQRISGLGDFLSTSYAMANGYNAAMGTEFGDMVLVLIMLAATLAAACVRCALMPVAAVRKCLVLIWIMGLLYVNWKHVCVRADYYHMELLFAFMPIVAISVEALPAIRHRAALWSSLGILICLFVSVAIIRGQFDESFFPFNCVKQACSNMTGNLGMILRPAQYVQRKTEAFQAEEKVEQLPRIRTAVAEATVDVFGYSQSYALFNKINYHPRPVFQSYMAYSRATMEANDRFYLSDKAPEFVIFELAPIGGRFPPVEDAHVLRDLLVRYQPVLSEEHFLLLRHSGMVKPELTLIKEGIVSAGEPIELQNLRQTNIWLEIELQPSLPGRLQQFFYKPASVRLVIQRRSEGASELAFPVPAAMLSAGFVAGPIVLDKDDVKRVYDGGKTLWADSYSIELPANASRMWQSKIHYRVYRIDNRIGGSPR